MKILGIGGGTGLPILLSGLKALRETEDPSLEIKALVAVSDNGGSTGELRRTLGLPAVGDLRNCLVALAGSHSVLRSLCRHRFENADGLTGHPVGNLIIAALYQMSGDFSTAVKLASELLDLQGSVLPSTDTLVTLCAEYLDGTSVRGESLIPLCRQPIRRVWIDPESPLPAPGVLDAIAEADAIVLGPGSLYTSVIPNLLVADVADAIHASPAAKIYVCNLMTQPGETDGLSAADHLNVLQQYLPSHCVDLCVMNTNVAGIELADQYQRTGATLVAASGERVRRLGVVPQGAPLLTVAGRKVRHDSIMPAKLILECARRRAEWEVLCAES